MKKILILEVIFFLLSSPLSAQTKNDYLLKSKNQKTAAWILLGGGVTVGFIGSYEMFYDLTEIGNGEHHNKIGTGLSLGLIGALAGLGSIPLFISSSKNKLLAMSMSLIPQHSPSLV